MGEGRGDIEFYACAVTLGISQYTDELSWQSALSGIRFNKARGLLLMIQMLQFSRLGPPWLADHGQCLGRIAAMSRH